MADYQASMTVLPSPQSTVDRQVSPNTDTLQPIRLSGLPFVRINEPMRGAHWSCEVCGFRDNRATDQRCTLCNRVNFQAVAAQQGDSLDIRILAGGRQEGEVGVEQRYFLRVDEGVEGHKWTCLCGVTNLYNEERCNACKRVNFQVFFANNRSSLAGDIRPSEKLRVEAETDSGDQWLHISAESVSRETPEKPVWSHLSQETLSALPLLRPCAPLGAEECGQKEWVCVACRYSSNALGTARCVSCRRLDFRAYTAANQLPTRTQDIIRQIVRILPTETGGNGQVSIGDSDQTDGIDEKDTRPAQKNTSSYWPRAWVIVPTALLFGLLWVCFQTVNETHPHDLL